MSKVMAIIDKPKNCDYCIFAVCKYSQPLSTHRKGYYCKLKDAVTVEDFDFDAEVHLRDCPLQEVPEKADSIRTEKVIAEEYKGGWIPCSERLPENDENVFVWFEYFRFGEYNRLFQTCGISHTFKGEWSGFVNGESGWRQLRIIAWMPLPEPYQKEGE